MRQLYDRSDKNVEYLSAARIYYGTDMHNASKTRARYSC
jgi:hypothetical protein